MLVGFLVKEFMKAFLFRHNSFLFQENIAHSLALDFVYLSTLVSRNLKITQHLALTSHAREQICFAWSPDA